MRTWTRWEWQKEPDLPRTWGGERRDGGQAPTPVAAHLVEIIGDPFAPGISDIEAAGLFVQMQVHQGQTFLVATSHAERMKRWYAWLEGPEGKTAWLRAVVGAPAVGEDAWSTAWPFRNIILALRASTQAELEAGVPALLASPSQAWALLLELTEEVELDPPTCPDCGGHDDVSGNDGATPFCRECDGMAGDGVEMAFSAWLDPCASEDQHGIGWVLVRGQTGPTAKPMHPAWVRAARDQAKDAGVPFAFLGWGDFVPHTTDAPPQLNGFSRRRRAWLAGGATGDRPQRQGNEDIWWEQKLVTEWGALDPATGEYAKGWNPFSDETGVCRVGAEQSGRLLDGVEHDDRPEIAR